MDCSYLGECLSGSGRRTGWRARDWTLLADQLGRWFNSQGAHTGADWIFWMEFLRVEGEMTGCGRLFNAVLWNTQIPPS